MSKSVEDRLQKIPVIREFTYWLKKIHLPVGESISLYDLIELYVIGIVKGMFTYRSGAISFSFFMAIFPFLLFVLNLIPYVPINNFQQDFLHFLENLLPPKTSDLFSGIFYDISNNRRVGLLSSVGVLSILLMSNGINAIFGGFEHSYHIQLTRSLVKQYLISMGVAIMMSVSLIIIVAAFAYYQIYVIPKVGHLLSSFTENDIWTLKISEVLLFIIIIYFFASILYYFGIRHESKKRFFTFGALLTTLLTILTTYLFSIYVNHFSRYNELYGSIGALLILMLYIWINCNILLLGFEFNASIISLKRTKVNQ